MDMIHSDHALGRNADARLEIDSFVADFKSNPNALALLAQYAAEVGDPDTAERTRSLVGPGNQAPGFNLCAVRACIVARDYRRALRAIALAQADRQHAGGGYGSALAGLRALALFGAEDGGAKLAFSEFLALTDPLRPVDALFVVGQLKGMGLADESRRLLERVCAVNPQDSLSLAELVRSDAAAGNRTALLSSVPRLLKTRKPPRDVLVAAERWLDPGRDTVLRSQINEALAHSPSV
jgi:hypothetical protein